MNNLESQKSAIHLVCSWLSYPENKPEDFTFVLATLKSPNDTWVDIVGFANGEFQLPERGITNFVTHWMLIPPAAS